MNFDEELTFGKLSKLSFLTNLFPKYQKFVDVVEDLKLKEKLNLNMEYLFDEVTFIQKHFDIIQSTEWFKKIRKNKQQMVLYFKK